MDAKSPPGKALSLEPIDFPTAGGDAERKRSDESPPAGQSERDLRISTADEFLARAAKEYEGGQVDQKLWRLAAGQGTQDESLVIAAYLRARATALQLEQRRAGAAQAAARPGGPSPGGHPRLVAPAVLEDEEPGVRRGGMQPKVKYWAAGIGAAVVLVLVVVWLFASPRESASVRQAVDSTTPAPASSAAKGEHGATPDMKQNEARPAFESEIKDLKQAGNWNVVVLYASNWTRKEPNNAAAWYELSVAYMQMRQLDDAFHAATHAVQLAPQEGALWNNLGQVNLALERLPEANVAFDKALGLRGDDPEALCGAALVAQRQGRRTDADALAGRVKSADGCRGVTAAAVAH
jgi:tetratricopeptide (TPR) repeat protein